MRKNAEATVQDTDWGPNADGWEFDIENRSNRDLRIDYAPTSNVASADKVIPAGKFGRVKGLFRFQSALICGVRLPQCRRDRMR